MNSQIQDIFQDEGLNSRDREFNKQIRHIEENYYNNPPVQDKPKKKKQKEFENQMEKTHLGLKMNVNKMHMMTFGKKTT